MTDGSSPLKDDLSKLRELSERASADVIAERQRQIEAEGWTPDHDDQHDDGSLAKAAACYAVGTSSIGWRPATSGAARWKPLWPWSGRWWKPKDRRSNLVRAGALIIAEIERLDRRLLKEGGEG